MHFLPKSLLFFLLFPAFAFAQPQFETRILRNAAQGKITQYETIEIGIRFPAQERMFRTFLEDHSKGKNPFTQHFLRLQFSCHGKSYIAEAFYMQDAAADENANKYVTRESEWPWRVRFAVPDTGQWQCTVLVGEIPAQAVPQSSGISFKCIPGKLHGYIHVAPDHKHFQYSDGTPFFALGQNIAWAGEPILHDKPIPPSVVIGGYYSTYHFMDNLAANGGNYVRIVMPYWSTGLEWEEIGVYAQDRAWALDSMIRLAELRGLHVHLCLDLTTGFVKGDAKENQHPYRRAFQKEGMTAADLLRDSSVLENLDNYIRYVHARWAFSPTVATIELMGEQDRWEGYAGRENYFSGFYAHADHLLRDELGDHDHLLSTSISLSHISIYKYDAYSFIDVHHYDNDLKCNQKRFSYVQRNSVEKMNKPFLYGEIGMINGPVNACDADDQEGCSDISMHNTLWATMFMGAAGTGSYWWQWKNNAYRAENFVPLRYFLDSVFVNPSLYPRVGEWTGNGLETFYNISEKRDRAVGWVHNTSYWWGNMTDSCRDRHGYRMIHPKDDDKASAPENRAGNSFTVSGLLPGKTYSVKLLETRKTSGLIQHLWLKTNRLGKLKIPFPDRPDCAYFISQEVPQEK